MASTPKIKMASAPSTDRRPASGPKRKAIKAEVKALNRLCYDNGVSTTARYLLVTLYSYTDEHGRCYPSHSLLEKDTGLAERTIRKALDELEAAGLLRRTRPGKRANGVKGRFTMGSKKLPAGQSLYLVWPVASGFGKGDFARLVGCQASIDEMNEPKWFVHQGESKPEHGPNSVDAMMEYIRAGTITPDRQVRLASGKWFSAVDVPLFAPEFRSPVRLAS